MEFYGYRKCSTCRDAFKYLQAKGIETVFQDFVESPPSQQQLTNWIARKGEGALPFMNIKGTRYKELGLKDKNLSNEELIELMSTDGKLIKRPVLVTDKTVLVGFDKALYDAL